MRSISAVVSLCRVCGYHPGTNAVPRSSAIISTTRRYTGGFEGYQQPDTKHDAYERALELSGNFPCIILVNPFLDQNVGSVARCMLNYGLTELRIVNPVCDIRSDQTKSLSAGAYKIIENAKVYEDVETCVRDLTRVLATSNRPRHMTQMVVTVSNYPSLYSVPYSKYILLPGPSFTMRRGENVS